MVNSVIDRRLQRAHTVLHPHLVILEYHGSLRQTRQCNVIAARPARRDSHRRLQRSVSIGLAHNTSCSLHLRAILARVCFKHRCLEWATISIRSFSSKVFSR